MDFGLRFVCKGGGVLLIGMLTVVLDCSGILLILKILAKVSFLIKLLRSTNKSKSLIVSDGQNFKPLLKRLICASDRR